MSTSWKLIFAEPIVTGLECPPLLPTKLRLDLPLTATEKPPTATQFELARADSKQSLQSRLYLDHEKFRRFCSETALLVPYADQECLFQMKKSRSPAVRIFQEVLGPLLR